jgi:signal transduction histidine kinase
VGTDAATTPTLASLRASRAQQEAVVRWLRPLALVVMAVVVGVAFRSRPAPGLAGRHLAVSIALAGFVLGGLALLATVPAARERRSLAAVTLVLAGSVALIWLQPGGAGVAGIFLGLSMLAPLLRDHLSVPLTAVAVIFLGVLVAALQRGSIATALLNAVMLGAFYGMTFLALRLGEANRLAEHLVVELAASREAQARAAGLAERQRLAREMHDVLAHALSGLMLQLEGARMLAAEDPSDPRLPEVVNRAHQLGKAGLDEARRAIGMLRDDELPGPERLPGLAAEFERDRGVPCRFTVTGAPRELGSEARLALYRVAQEALTNVAKHANAERVDVRLAYGGSATRLTVEDFGNTGQHEASDGYGLTGMRERAELLGGTLTAGPTATGFRVELDVPR